MEARFGATTSSTHYPAHWNLRLRELMEIPVNHETGRFFEAWARSEGGDAKWNPLNSTLWLGGWTEKVNYNDIPVRNYKYAIVGIVATALTLSQRKPDNSFVYSILRTELMEGIDTADKIVRASWADLKLWGTNPQTILDVLKTLA